MKSTEIDADDGHDVDEKLNRAGSGSAETLNCHREWLRVLLVSEDAFLTIPPHSTPSTSPSTATTATNDDHEKGLVITQCRHGKTKNARDETTSITANAPSPRSQKTPTPLFSSPSHQRSLHRPPLPPRPSPCHTKTTSLHSSSSFTNQYYHQEKTTSRSSKTSSRSSRRDNTSSIVQYHSQLPSHRSTWAISLSHRPIQPISLKSTPTSTSNLLSTTTPASTRPLSRSIMYRLAVSLPHPHSPLPQTVEALTPLSGVDTSPSKLGAETLSGTDTSMPLAQPEPEDAARIINQGLPVDIKTDTTGEYGTRQPVDTVSPDKESPLGTTKDGEPSQPAGETVWERRAPEDRNVPYDDRNTTLAPSRATPYDNGPQNEAPATASDAHFSSPEDRPFYDRDRDRDRNYWDRDRDRHDSIRDRRDRDIRDRRPDFFGRSYGRSHAPRPPPELRHYEPSYGNDYALPRRYDPDDRHGGFRNPSLDDRSKPPPFDDTRPPFDVRRPPPPPAADDDRRPTLDDRPIRRLPGSDTRALPPNSEDRTRPVGDSIPHSRTTAEDDRTARATSLAADDRPRANVPLEERLSQPAPTPSLQDRLSQPVSTAVPARVDIAPTPSLEERLSSGPVPRNYARSASVARDNLRAPLPKDDFRDHDRVNDFRNSRAFSRERNGPPFTASTYRPDLDRHLGNRDDRDRRDRDVDVDPPPARYGEAFNRGPPPPRRYSPPPMLDRDRERDRGRPYYPPRSPPPFRGDGVYDPDGDRRYATDRERDTYELRRRDWYGPGDDDKRGPPPPPASWRPHDRPPFIDRDRDRFDRERDRDRDFRERDRERERDRDLGNLVPPPPTRAHWDDRDRRIGIPLSLPDARMDTAGGVGPGRSLGARLTDPYPPPSGGDDRVYPPLREFDRGRYGGPPLDDHAHGPSFSRVRNRSPSPPRRGPGLADDLRPPLKRVREDNGAGLGAGLGAVGGPGYSPLRRGGGVAGEHAPVPLPLSTATTTTTTTSGVASVSGTIAARSTGTRTPPPPGGAFYDRDQRERERERDYVRGEYGMGYDRDDRGRRSPPMVSRMGLGGGYGRGVMGRDDRRYVPPPPPRAS